MDGRGHGESGWAASPAGYYMDFLVADRWTLILVVVIVGIIVLTTVLFTGTLSSYVPITLTSDRAGLVMESGGKPVNSSFLRPGSSGIGASKRTDAGVVLHTSTQMYRRMDELMYGQLSIDPRR